MNYAQNPQVDDNHSDPDGIEVHPAVVGLSGGNKQIWLRHHRTEIMGYYHENGPDATMRRYNMRQYTLTSFLITRRVELNKLTKSDRALDIAKIAIEGTRDIRGKVSEIEDRLDELEPLAAIGYGFLAAIQQLTPIIQLGQSKMMKPLNLTDLRAKLGK